MTQPWDDDPVVDTEPWNSDPAVDEVQSKTKSEETLRALNRYSMVDYGRGLVGLGEGALAVGSSIYDAIASGAAGTAGFVAGMVPGGESPMEKAATYFDESKGMYQYEPRTDAGKLTQQAIGDVAQKGIEGAKFIGSGYAALAGLPGGADEGARAQREFMQEPFGEGVFRHTGSPAAATLTQLLPEIASLGIPIKAKPKGAAPRYPSQIDIPEGYGGQPRPRVEQPRSRAPEPEPVPQGVYDELQTALANRDKPRVLELINANPVLVRAFEELGIEFTPGMVSENQALRQVEAGLQSVPGNQIAAASEQAQSLLQKRARELIDDSGGSSGKTMINENVRAEYDRVQKGLLDEAEEAYKELGDLVPRTDEVNLQSIADDLRDTAELLGKGDIDKGLTRMSKHERELFRLTHDRVKRQKDPDNLDAGTIEVWEYDPPIYEAVDRYRRKLGVGMKNQQTFKDAAQGELSYRYGQMANAQKEIAEASGYGDLWKKANDAVSTRKDLEAAMQRTLGRQLQKGVTQKIHAATNNLLKGDPNMWDELMRDLPNNQRQAAAATALETVMFTAGQGTRMSQRFVDNFTRIKRDAGMRSRLLQYLPSEQKAQFMRIGEAASGFFRSVEKLNRSNTANANAVIRGIEDGTMWSKLFGGLRSGGERLPVFGEVFKRTRQKSDVKKDRSRAAADLLASDDLRRAVLDYAEGRPTPYLEKSPIYLRFENTLTTAEKAQIARVGIVAYLFGEDE